MQHQMHGTIVIDDLSVSLSVMQAGCKKMAEEVNVLLWVKTSGDPRNIVLDDGRRHSAVGGMRFDAAFAKFLWPVVILVTRFYLPFQHLIMFMFLIFIN